MRYIGITGEATVSFIVDATGTVRDVKVVDSTHKAFEAAAAEAVKHWTFSAGIKGGRPVSTRMTVPIKFSLPGTEKSWF